jgi:hypothetical protein
VTDLNETNEFLARSQRLHDAVDTIARQAKHDVNVPFHQCVDEDLSGIRHRASRGHYNDKRSGCYSGGEPSGVSLRGVDAISRRSVSLSNLP